MTIHKVMLLVPPAFSSNQYRETNPLPPIGLGYLAAILESMGIQVSILDCLMRGWDQEERVDQDTIRIGLSDAQIRESILTFSPDMVGLTCQFSRQFRMNHHLLALIKSVSNGILTVAGGAHATVCTEEVLSDENCDYLIKGEAEFSLRQLVEALNSNKSATGIDGLCYKDGGNLVVSEKTGWIKELDAIPFPAYHLMDLGLYHKLKDSHGNRHRDRFCPIITTRGCPAKCTFCTAKAVWGNAFRARSVENVIAEMRLLKSRYGIEELMFEDDNLTANAPRAKALFTMMVQENFGFVWDTPNGVGIWALDEEAILLMQRSGCIRIGFPVESGSQRVLDKVIKKPLKLDKVKRLINYCRQIDLDLAVFLVIGMPGETVAEMWESFRFVADCGCYAPHISVATPYPGSQMYEECRSKGYFAREYSLDDLYIRSFMIKTPEWDEATIRAVLLKAHLYLKWRMLRDDPGHFLTWFLSKFGQLRHLWGYFRRTFCSPK